MGRCYACSQENCGYRRPPCDCECHGKKKPVVSTDSQLQHMKHKFEGYRANIMGEYDCPFSPGSARAYSWNEGFKQATDDKPADSPPCPEGGFCDSDSKSDCSICGLTQESAWEFATAGPYGGLM